MNAGVERYLGRATRGLWGRRRREVREELAAHLYGRVQAHRIAGLSEDDAVEKALAELGSPGLVNAGMARLYTLPTVMGSSVAVMVLCLAVAALWTRGLAQTLGGTFYYPTRNCLETISARDNSSSERVCAYINDEFWVRTEALQKVLEPQGVTFEKSGFAAVMLRVTVPGSSPFYLEPYPHESISGIGVIARGYTSFWNVVERFALTQNARVRISGWDTPTFFLNEASFRLGDRFGQAEGEAFFKSYLSAALYEGLAVDSRWGQYKTTVGFSHEEISPLLNSKSERAFRTLRLSIGGRSGEPYGLVTLIDPTSALGRRLADVYNLGDAAFYLLDVVRVGQDGTVSVNVPKGRFKLVRNVSFPRVQSGDSALVRLAGGTSQNGGWYEVVSPEDITFTARN